MMNEKRKKNAEVEVPEDFVFAGPLVDDSQNLVMKRRDKRLAEKDPQAYCADRCVSTGNCDVYEDLFHMSPKQVMEFCTDCVLSLEEDPCDVPDALFEDDGTESRLNP